MRKILTRFYYWMLKSLPRKVMFKKVYFDGVFIWRQRFGYTNKQIEEMNEWADKMYKGLKWK